MPRITSPNWNEALGVCTKHQVPMVPCPQCMEEQDPEIEARVTELDLVHIAMDPDFELKNCFAPSQAWLMERVTA